MTNDNATLMRAADYGDLAPQHPSQLAIVGDRDSATQGAIAQARAEVEAAYAVAMRRPRNIEAVRQRVLGSCRRPRFAQVAKYSRPVGDGKTITGLSIRAAEEFIRQMGNVRVAVVCTHENDIHKRVAVTVCDLESNSGFTQEFTITKTVERYKTDGREVVGERLTSRNTKVFIVKAYDDEVFVKENAMISRIIRNHAIRLLPGDIQDEASDLIDEVAGASSSESGKNAVEQARIVGDALFKYFGVSAADVERFTGCPLAQMTQGDVAKLRAAYVGMRDEGARFADYIEIAEREREAKRNGKAEGDGDKPKHGTKKEAPKAPPAPQGGTQAPGAAAPTTTPQAPTTAPQGDNAGKTEKPSESATPEPTDISGLAAPELRKLIAAEGLADFIPDGRPMKTRDEIASAVVVARMNKAKGRPTDAPADELFGKK